MNIKLGKSALSKYVNGKQSPDQDRIYLLSKTLNVIEPWLMGFDVSSKRKQDNGVTETSHYNNYNYFDVGLSAALLSEVNPFTSSDVKQLALRHDYG